MGTRGLQECLSEWRRALLVMEEEKNSIFLLAPQMGCSPNTTGAQEIAAAASFNCWLELCGPEPFNQGPRATITADSGGGGAAEGKKRMGFLDLDMGISLSPLQRTPDPCTSVPSFPWPRSAAVAVSYPPETLLQARHVRWWTGLAQSSRYFHNVPTGGQGHRCGHAVLCKNFRDGGISY
jgi:hypothetical protein